MPCIYKATNRNNRKAYIGFTIDLEKRKLKHKDNAERGRQSKFYSAIRKHGWDSFDWEILFDNEDASMCHDVMEQSFIEKFDTLHNGYNMCEGGLGVPGMTKGSIWINDGIKHKRITEDRLAEFPNWSRGRIGLTWSVKMSDETKKRIGSKNKAHGTMSRLNQNVQKCQHCQREMNLGQLTRHLRNCGVILP